MSQRKYIAMLLNYTNIKNALMALLKKGFKELKYPLLCFTSCHPKVLSLKVKKDLFSLFIFSLRKYIAFLLNYTSHQECEKSLQHLNTPYFISKVGADA